MIIRLLAAFVASLMFVACAQVPKGSGGITSETFMISALDPGIQIHVRNKHRADEERFPPERIVLFVHGATFPSETTFDIDLPGGSWMDLVARRGFDAYLMDVRGYGRSSRPAAMEQPPAANAPFADTRDAVRDISAAVEFILKRRGVARIDLVGWSWGTTTTRGMRPRILPKWKARALRSGVAPRTAPRYKVLPHRHARQRSSV